MEEMNGDVIVEVLECLKNNNVESKCIYDVFNLLCDKGHFDCGAVYEINHNKYYLMEHYNASSMTLHPSLVLDSYEIDDRTYYVNKDRLEESGFAGQLYNIYNAKTLFAVPIVDDKNCMEGFVTVFNVNDENIFDEESIKILSLLLYMLIHYVDRRIYVKKSESSMTTLDAVLNNSGIDVYVNDYDNHDILYVNQSMAAPYGGVEKLMGRKCWESLFPNQSGPCEFCPKYNIVDENKEPSNIYSWDYQRAFDGSWFRVFSAAFYWGNGRLAHVVSSADITDNKLNEARIENLANYDQLTQLPNRRMLLKECEKRINNASTNEKGYVLFFDIDGFKMINDSYGHDAGDEFLIKLAEFFLNIPILKDSIYRNGGDEFVAVLGGENLNKNNVRDLSSFILSRFKKVWHIKGHEVYCNASIGVACFPEDGNTPENLIQIADRAMYRVKRAGGAGVCFGYELEQNIE